MCVYHRDVLLAVVSLVLDRHRRIRSRRETRFNRDRVLAMMGCPQATHELDNAGRVLERGHQAIAEARMLVEQPRLPVALDVVLVLARFQRRIWASRWRTVG